MSGANDDTRMVDYVADFDALRRELSLAVESGEAVGGGILDVRGRDNSMCYARTDQVMCECGRPRRVEDRSHGLFLVCCGRQIESCCGE